MMDEARPEWAAFIKINTDVSTCGVWVAVLMGGFHCSLLSVSRSLQTFPKCMPLVCLYVLLQKKAARATDSCIKRFCLDQCNRCM